MPFKSGTDNPRCKLTIEDVVWIFTNPQKLTQVQLAAVYGISQPSINHILHSRTWRHVTNELRL